MGMRNPQRCASQQKWMVRMDDVRFEVFNGGLQDVWYRQYHRKIGVIEMSDGGYSDYIRLIQWHIVKRWRYHFDVMPEVSVTA